MYGLRLIFILAFVACHPVAQDRNEPAEAVIQKVEDKPLRFDLDEIISRGSLIAIIDNSSTGYFLYKGQAMGYEYELLSRLADKMGVKLELVITSDIQEAIDMLNRGEGDVVAHSLTVTKERRREIAFTKHHYLVKQVLVQRKPDNWRNMKSHEVESKLIRNPIELAGKEVYVRKNSAHIDRLYNLSDEIAADILVVEERADVDTETLIRQVANGTLDYTVADENLATVNAAYFADLDVSTAISFPQKTSWGLRKEDTQLLAYMNDWLSEMKSTPDFNMLFAKYFRSPNASKQRMESYYSSLTGGKLSPYDEIIQQHAVQLGWDWRLLAAQIFQESRFDPEAASWAGAMGLMQLMPATGKEFGVEDQFFDPEESIIAGVQYLNWLERFWSTRVEDEDERLKFILASYNVGQGHVLDARKLATKYGKDPEIWEGHVENFLMKKSYPEFYTDPVVSLGYCRGEEPVNYVKNIFKRFEQYKIFIHTEDIRRAT